MKVVKNICYGRFSISQECVDWLITNKSWTQSQVNSISSVRTHPDLIEAIEALGSEKCSGPYAKLIIVEVPDNTEWYVHEYEGYETIRKVHGTW